MDYVYGNDDDNDDLIKWDWYWVIPILRSKKPIKLFDGFY